MSTAEQDSGLRLVKSTQADDARASEPLSSTPASDSPNISATGSAADAATSGLWLNGEVLACACPDCHGPMSIRLWLMVADCWMCGTSIELTEEQERAARILLASKPPTPAAVPPPKQPPAKPRQAAARQPTPPRPSEAAKPIALSPAARTKPSPRPAPSPAPPKPAAARQAPIKQPASKARLTQRPTPALPVAAASYDWLRDLPAWLVSLIVHVVAMLLLGLLTVPLHNPRQHPILLAATFGKPGLDGGEKHLDELEQAAVIEDPGPEQEPEPAPPIEPPLPDPVIEPPQPIPPRDNLVPLSAELHARELPSLDTIRDALVSPASHRMFEGRDPRVRTQLVLTEGGSMYTEAAVAQGLRWLSRHQADDGHWSLDHFDHHGDCDCDGQGNGNSDVGATGLALLPFLGAGQTHTRGIYRETVERGLAWLLDQQKSNGDLRGRGQGRMYAHGISSIVLCEAYALTGDPNLKNAAQRAINFIVRAQHPGKGDNTGGWRYEPRQPGDTSVVGWQLMALRSGRMAGLSVPEKTFKQAESFLDYVQKGRYGGLYSYQRSRSPDEAMTAEGLLCRQYLGWPADHPGMLEGAGRLLAEHLPSRYDPNIYYWYYGTQVMHHLGGRPWERWNSAMREALVELQEREGHRAGSWPPIGGAIGGHDTSVGGRLYVTALATCTLEVYYRHLPIYRAIELGGERAAP
jgi:hypothetical protein